MRVPADIAAGPGIQRWASTETLDALAALQARRASAQRVREAHGDAMVSAWCRWRDARDEWARGVGLTPSEGMALVPGRRPYLDPAPPARAGGAT